MLSSNSTKTKFLLWIAVLQLSIVCFKSPVKYSFETFVKYLGISFDDKFILQSQVGKHQVKALQYFGIANKPCTPVNLTAARSYCCSCVFSAFTRCAPMSVNTCLSKVILYTCTGYHNKMYPCINYTEPIKNDFLFKCSKNFNSLVSLS